MPADKDPSLLPDSENNNTTFGQVLRWLTTVGRFVIVFTELIVISAFLSRFWLDRKNSDLSEVIRQQKAILESTKDFEIEFNLLQDRLKIIKEFYAVDNDFQSQIKTLVESTPFSINYTSLSLVPISKNSPATANISLTSNQEEAIVDFITNLAVNPKIQDVNVRSIEKKARDSRYFVSLSLTFKKST